MEAIVKWLYPDVPEPIDLEPTSPFYEANALMAVLSEHRIWKLPKHVVRDFVVIPAYREFGYPAAIQGAEYQPMMDRVAEMEMDWDYHHSTAAERRAPKPDHSRIIEAVIRLSVLRARGPFRSMNHHFVTIAQDLGISRNVVWRVMRKTLRSYPKDGWRLEAVLAADLALGRRIDEFEQLRRCSKGRR